LGAITPKKRSINFNCDVTHTPYSGMLPGHIAGFYDFAETHIDLPSLAGILKHNSV